MTMTSLAILLVVFLFTSTSSAAFLHQTSQYNNVRKAGGGGGYNHYPVNKGTTSNNNNNNNNKVALAAKAKPPAAAANGAAAAAAAPSSSLVFTDQVYREIADQVLEEVKIPFAPAPLVSYCLKQILERMGRDLTPETLNRVHDVLAAEATISPYDDATPQDVQRLADQVAKELGQKSSIFGGTGTSKLLSQKQEQVILQQIVRVIMKVATTSDYDRRMAWISKLQITQQNLWTNPGRLATIINEKIDIPLLNEDQEQALFLKAIKQCANTLQELLPPHLLQTLQQQQQQLQQGEDGKSSSSSLATTSSGRQQQEDMSDFKEYLVKVVNEKVDLIGFNEQQEAAMIRTMIDVLIDAYSQDDPTALLMFTSSPMERRTKLEQKLAQIEWEIQASQSRFQTEQERLKQQQQTFQDMLDNELKQQQQQQQQPVQDKNNGKSKSE